MAKLFQLLVVASILFFGTCYAGQACSADYECQNASANAGYVSCVSNQCTCHSGFSGDGTSANPCSCGYPNSVSWDSSNVAHCLSPGQCFADWNCGSYSTNYLFVGCHNGFCTCNSGFAGHPPSSQCSCRGSLTWTNGVPNCCNDAPNDFGPCTSNAGCLSGFCNSGICSLPAKMNFETRPFYGNPAPHSTADAHSIWNSLTPNAAGYCSAQVLAVADGYDNHETCGGPAGTVGFHVSGTFYLSSGATVGIRYGPDAGYGGTLSLDGVVLQERWADMWWAGSFADPNQILWGSASLSAGFHTVDYIGFEGCCDGRQTFQYQAPFLGFNDPSWRVFTTQ